jgi:hypothetical protein
VHSQSNAKQILIKSDMKHAYCLKKEPYLLIFFYKTDNWSAGVVGVFSDVENAQCLRMRLSV